MAVGGCTGGLDSVIYLDLGIVNNFCYQCCWPNRIEEDKDVAGGKKEILQFWK